eukprot:Nk52_evm95s352 gene=Nk52_evmTU95s352
MKSLLKNSGGEDSSSGDFEQSSPSPSLERGPSPTSSKSSVRFMLEGEEDEEQDALSGDSFVVVPEFDLEEYKASGAKDLEGKQPRTRKNSKKKHTSGKVAGSNVSGLLSAPESADLSSSSSNSLRCKSSCKIRKLFAPSSSHSAMLKGAFRKKKRQSFVYEAVTEDAPFIEYTLFSDAVTIERAHMQQENRPAMDVAFPGGGTQNFKVMYNELKYPPSFPENSNVEINFYLKFNSPVKSMGMSCQFYEENMAAYVKAPQKKTPHYVEDAGIYIGEVLPSEHGDDSEVMFTLPARVPSLEGMEEEIGADGTLVNEDDETWGPDMRAFITPKGMRQYEKQGKIRICRKLYFLNEKGERLLKVAFGLDVVKVFQDMEEVTEKRIRALERKEMLSNLQGARSCKYFEKVTQNFGDHAPKWKKCIYYQLLKRTAEEQHKFEDLVHNENVLQKKLMYQERKYLTKPNKTSEGKRRSSKDTVETFHSNVVRETLAITEDEPQEDFQTLYYSSMDGVKLAYHVLYPSERRVPHPRRKLSTDLQKGSSLASSSSASSSTGSSVITPFGDGECEDVRGLAILISSPGITNKMIKMLGRDLADKYNMAVFVPMMRGLEGSQGDFQSTKKRRVLWEDIRSLVRFVKWNHRPKHSSDTNIHPPVVLMGHSVGANLVLSYGCWNGREDVDGYCLVSPLFKETVSEYHSKSLRVNSFYKKAAKLSNGKLFGRRKAVDLLKAFPEYNAFLAEDLKSSENLDGTFSEGKTSTDVQMGQLKYSVTNMLSMPITHEKKSLVKLINPHDEKKRRASSSDQRNSHNSVLVLVGSVDEVTSASKMEALVRRVSTAFSPGSGKHGNSTFGDKIKSRLGIGTKDSTPSLHKVDTTEDDIASSRYSLGQDNSNHSSLDEEENFENAAGNNERSSISNHQQQRYSSICSFSTNSNNDSLAFRTVKEGTHMSILSNAHCEIGKWLNSRVFNQPLPVG